MVFYRIAYCSKLIKPMGLKSHPNFSYDVMESFYIYANLGTGSNVGRRQNIFQKWFSYGTLTVFFLPAALQCVVQDVKTPNESKRE